MAAYLADLHGGAVAAPFNSAFTYRPPGIRSRISRGSLGAFPCGSPQSRRRRMPPLLTAIPKAACLAQPRLSASSNLLRRRRDGLTDHGTWTRTDRVAAHAVWLATWLSSSRELSASGCAALWRTWSILRPSQGPVSGPLGRRAAAVRSPIAAGPCRAYPRRWRTSGLAMRGPPGPGLTARPGSHGTGRKRVWPPFSRMLGPVRSATEALRVGVPRWSRRAVRSAQATIRSVQRPGNRRALEVHATPAA